MKTPIKFTNKMAEQELLISLHDGAGLVFVDAALKFIGGSFLSDCFADPKDFLSSFSKESLFKKFHVSGSFKPIGEPLIG